MMIYLIRKAVPKLKFNKEYLQRLTKPIPKKEAGTKEATTAEVQAKPRHANGFLQYCMNCGKDQTFRFDALGLSDRQICPGTAPDKSASKVRRGHLFPRD